MEATAGNTGLGIAFAALNKGYKIIFVVPTKFSEEKQTLTKTVAIAAQLDATALSLQPQNKKGKPAKKTKDITKFVASFRISRNVTAKTGTVTGVSALAGYCTAANGHYLCFSIINNGIRKAQTGRTFQDRVCEALCTP